MINYHLHFFLLGFDNTRKKRMKELTEFLTSCLVLTADHSISHADHPPVGDLGHSSRIATTPWRSKQGMALGQGKFASLGHHF
jgi:hypothetical protein